MKIRILLLVFTVFSFAVTAQVKNFEFKAAANSTFINSVSKNLSLNTPVPINPSTGFIQTTSILGSIKESYESKVGFDVASTFQIWEYKNFYLRTGLGVQYLRFHNSKTIEIQEQNQILIPGYLKDAPIIAGYPYGTLFGIGVPRNPDGSILLDPNGFPVGQGQLLDANPNLGKTSALYLQIPISIGRTFFSEKLMVSANLQAQFLAQSSVVKEEFTNGSIKEYKDKSSDGFKNTLFLVGVESAYKILGPLAVFVSYNRSLTPIYDEGAQNGSKTFYNNVSLGLSYSLQ